MVAADRDVMRLVQFVFDLAVPIKRMGGVDEIDQIHDRFIFAAQPERLVVEAGPGDGEQFGLAGEADIGMASVDDSPLIGGRQKSIIFF